MSTSSPQEAAVRSRSDEIAGSQREEQGKSRSTKRLRSPAPERLGAN